MATTTIKTTRGTPPATAMKPPQILLIFDINKVLVSRKSMTSEYVLRPFVKTFLAQLSRLGFGLAVWTSARKKSVIPIITELFTESGIPLVFAWYQEKCTETYLHQQEHMRADGSSDGGRVLVKDLSRVWKSFRRYNASNTIMIDDSTEKCVFNPPHTSIHPRPFIAYYKQPQPSPQLTLGGYQGGTGTGAGARFDNYHYHCHSSAVAPIFCCVPGLLDDSESEDEEAEIGTETERRRREAETGTGTETDANSVGIRPGALSVSADEFESEASDPEMDTEMRVPDGRLFAYLLRLQRFNIERAKERDRGEEIEAERGREREKASSSSDLVNSSSSDLVNSSSGDPVNSRSSDPVNCSIIESVNIKSINNSEYSNGNNNKRRKGSGCSDLGEGIAAAAASADNGDDEEEEEIKEGIRNVDGAPPLSRISAESPDSIELTVPVEAIEAEKAEITDSEHLPDRKRQKQRQKRRRPHQHQHSSSNDNNNDHINNHNINNDSNNIKESGQPFIRLHPYPQL